MTLVPPHGNHLVDLLVREDEHAYAATLPSLRLSQRAACDLEVLATGGFSPLDRFMGRADHDRVLGEMRLANGTLFPIPITLPVDDPPPLGAEVALRTSTNDIVAVLRVEEVYEWDAAHTAQSMLGTTDPRHPLVAEMAQWGRYNVSGPLRVLALPSSPLFRELRRTPAEVRRLLEALGHANVVAFQTRNPLHRAHEELLQRAVRKIDGTLLLHPAVGMTRPGDVDEVTRIRTYKAVANAFPRDRFLLSLLPLAMRMAGPREALWHAIIRRNFGASHFIVGRDHASPGNDSSGRPFWGPYDAQELLRTHGPEIGVEMVPFQELVYLASEERYVEATEVPSGAEVRSISGTEVRNEYLAKGRQLPEWFTRPEVAAILAEQYPAQHRRGFCVWFTGLSSAGKSTTAEHLVSLLLERGRAVTVLDGDVVRTHLSKGLGFSKEDRDTNIHRIAFVASEIVRHGGAVVCAAVSPYRAARENVRAMVGADRMFEIFVDTPLDVCESRDPKGIYAQARQGLMRNVTGIDEPYEAPEQPELVIETVTASARDNARRIEALLVERGFLR